MAMTTIVSHVVESRVSLLQTLSLILTLLQVGGTSVTDETGGERAGQLLKATQLSLN